MITAAQLRAARALLDIDQRELAKRSGLSLPTIQRMEASDGVVRGNVDSLMKLVDALTAGGIESTAYAQASLQWVAFKRRVLFWPSMAKRKPAPLKLILDTS